MARGAQTKQKARLIAGPDADEVEALNAAEQMAKDWGVVAFKARDAAAAIIGIWIIERAKRVASKRLIESSVFDLNDARLTGLIQASLPKIGEALANAGFPFEKAFGDLSKDEATSLFVAGAVAHREAAIAQGEAPDFPFDDPIPFGDPTEEARNTPEEGPPWE